jgi:hypothetical protein
MTSSATIYRLTEVPSILIPHFGQPLRLTPGAAIAVPATHGEDEVDQPLPRVA